MHTEKPPVLTIGEGPGETRVTVNVEGSLSLHDQYGRRPFVLDFPNLAAHADFVNEVMAAFEWRAANYLRECKAEIDGLEQQLAALQFELETVAS